MKLGRFKQSPSEVKQYAFDYSQWLGAGEQLSGVSFTVTPTGPTVTGALATGNTSILFDVSNVTDGVFYRVAANVTTTIGQVKEDWIDIQGYDPIVEFSQ